LGGTHEALQAMGKLLAVKGRVAPGPREGKPENGHAAHLTPDNLRVELPYRMASHIPMVYRCIGVRQGADEWDLQLIIPSNGDWVKFKSPKEHGRALDLILQELGKQLRPRSVRYRRGAELFIEG
jgi:hypothetical protein